MKHNISHSDILICTKGDAEYEYYLDACGTEVFHGKYVRFARDDSRDMYRFYVMFYYHGTGHGEVRFFTENGSLLGSCFYINGTSHPYVKMNEQEKLLFQIQHPGFRFIEE